MADLLGLAGIGTYISSSSLSHTTAVARFTSWYLKAKDSAVGSSFSDHVVGAYRFLMRFYSQGADLYFFGFSRGAYTARFLAEMLDHVGLLSPGSEELVRFAWKTFERWQQRRTGNQKDEEKKRQMFEFMKAFRETFSRPIRRIRFLGLLDCVNSVPRFEAAWMQRSKLPYTARSSAKVIRHAVSIDERRAKFRQDLVSGHSRDDPHHHHHLFHHEDHDRRDDSPAGQYMLRPLARGKQESVGGDPNRDFLKHTEGLEEPRSPEDRLMSTLYRASLSNPAVRFERRVSLQDHESQASSQGPDRLAYYEGDESPVDVGQSIEEVWFPGCHADIGGGWEPSPGESYQLSHVPLVWLVREARKAGLPFDEEKLRAFNCYDDLTDIRPSSQAVGSDGQAFPRVLVTASSNTEVPQVDLSEPPPSSSLGYLEALETAATRGRIHDCLSFKQGLPVLSVISWRIMEHLPFRRMDLQPDGSWKPIRWPLPRGEVRDIPDQAHIHRSALRRMAADPNYRPGNLIIGGGGRGIRVAPKEAGMGRWTVVGEEGDPVGEVYIREPHEKSN